MLRNENFHKHCEIFNHSRPLPWQIKNRRRNYREKTNIKGKQRITLFGIFEWSLNVVEEECTCASNLARPLGGSIQDHLLGLLEVLLVLGIGDAIDIPKLQHQNATCKVSAFKKCITRWVSYETRRFVNRGFKRDIGEKTKPKARRADFFKGNDNSKNFDYHIEKYDHIFDLTINQHGFSLDIFLNLNSYTQKKLPICKW